MKTLWKSVVLIFIISSCSNSPDMETGEIKTMQLLKQTFEQSDNLPIFVDAKTLLSRKQIDLAVLSPIRKT